MNAEERRAHWDRIYATKREAEVSWFEASPDASLAALARAGVTRGSAIIDVGGGASRLVDRLVLDGYEDVTVLDVSAAAIEAAKARLGKAADRMCWLCRRRDSLDARQTLRHLARPRRLPLPLDPADRAAYVERMGRALKSAGVAIIATFAPDGPRTCSGLPVARYDAANLSAVVGREFDLIGSRRYEHHTPSGASQPFQFSIFKRV